MKAILIFILFLFNVSTWAIDCVRNPIYCQIVENKPNIDKNYAMKLSNVIHNNCVKYNIPSNIFAALLMQESSYVLKTKGCYKGLVKNEVCEDNIPFNFILSPKQCEFKWEEVKVCADFGISQIHYKTAQRYGFDTNRLITDLEYSVEAGAIVLSDFKKRYAHKEVYWYTRYNASSKIKRKIYRKLIERFF